MKNLNKKSLASKPGRECDSFDSVTEDEIMYHWRAVRSKGLSDEDAWQAIVTGLAQDMAFAKSKTWQIEN